MELHLPNVEVREKLSYVQGESTTYETTETIEVPHVVHVPQVNPVVRRETREIPKQVNVPHIHRVEQYVEGSEQVIEKERIVEVPQKETVRRIRYVPQFVETPPGDCCALSPTDSYSEVASVRMIITKLERQRNELQEALAKSQRQQQDLQMAVKKE